MKIAIVTLGTRGDLQPFIALGLGLQKAGCNVLLISSKNEMEFVRGFGLPYHALNVDVQQAMENQAVQQIAKGDNPPILFYEGPRLGKIYNLLTYFIFENAFWQLCWSSANAFWKKRGKATIVPMTPPSRLQAASGMPTLYGYSEQFFARPHDWPGNIAVTGTWNPPNMVLPNYWTGFRCFQACWMKPGNCIFLSLLFPFITAPLGVDNPVFSLVQWCSAVFRQEIARNPLSKHLMDFAQRFPSVTYMFIYLHARFPPIPIGCFYPTKGQFALFIGIIIYYQ